MTLVSNLYLTHGLMIMCALAAVFAAVPESSGRAVSDRRMAGPALMGAMSALALIAYPTWGELKNPGLWMFAVVAAMAGVARGHWMRIEVDHAWHLVRLHRAYDCLAATAALAVMGAIEIVLAVAGPADQPTTELGMAVVAAFLVGRAATLLWRARHEPQSDLRDGPAPRPEG